MSYRYQEILGWVIPGFFFIFMILLVQGLSNDFYSIFTESPANDTKEILSILKPSAQFWNAVSAILIFFIPIASLITGWILNALGGFIMRFTYLRRYIISRACPEKNIKCIDAVNEYDTVIKSTNLNDLEQLDRFYYRYVFSRNMLAAQVALMITSVHIFWNTLFTPCFIKIIFLETVITLLFLVITARELITHATFVFYHSNKA